MTSSRERFLDCMDYRSSDRRPNHELGAWSQTVERWRTEAPEAVKTFGWDWFVAEPELQLDRREYIPVNFSFLPEYPYQVLEDTPEYEIFQDGNGVVHKALKEGTVGDMRLCMDQYLRFPIEQPEDFAGLKQRLVAAVPGRYPATLDQDIVRWNTRDFPLVLGRNCAANGFYWRAREFMGTEALSLAWYDHPALMHEMMEFFADFIIATSRPVLEKIQVDYFVLNEDMSMKGGPLLGPDTYREFILPHLKRLVAFLRSHGTRHVAVDSDGDPTLLIPLLMDAGVDTIWPVERASNVSPQGWRRQFGRELRIWGGVDKRILPLGPAAIRQHLREFIPLIEEGGFIPTIDHTVPPEVSWDNFRWYMEYKRALLRGDFKALA